MISMSSYMLAVAGVGGDITPGEVACFELPWPPVLRGSGGCVCAAPLAVGGACVASWATERAGKAASSARLSHFCDRVIIFLLLGVDPIGTFARRKHSAGWPPSAYGL